MFKKQARLDRIEFMEVFKSGRRHQFPALTIIVSPGKKLQVAVVVGKKVYRSAVQRNVAKRRVCAGLKRAILPQHYTGSVVVIVKPAYSTLSRKAANVMLMESIAQVLKGA